MAHTLEQSSLTLNFSKGGLSAGTTSTLSTIATINFVIGGLWQTAKTAITNGASPTTDWSTGNAFIPIPIPGTTTNLPFGTVSSLNGYTCAFLVGLDNTGALRAIQGQMQPVDVSGNPVTAPAVPSDLGPSGPNLGDNNFCPIGAVVVKLGPTAVATWTFGSNNWAGVTGVTTSFLDLAMLPARPLSGLTFS